MEFLYYTIAGIALYLLSDFILDQIEVKLGKRFNNRSAVFFVIILVLAVSTFKLIEHLTAG
ncbi:MAG: hypothetical protein P8Y12_08520 [Gammaproteobacteria bacterium]|jgi:hypothetical protein